ncbi:MAG: threonine/serine dehydratase [Leptospiraceae bacterium]|nr:threonine/serine dehydratase [Leptospiraceae bacterium]
MITLDSIQKRWQEIQPLVDRTPLIALPVQANEGGQRCWLKLENFQRTGSFKARGAASKLIHLQKSSPDKTGVITGSAGNHGLGLSAAASALGMAATIVVPRNAAAPKVAALQRYPIELILQGADYDAAEELAREIARQRGLEFVHAFSDPEVITGQASLGLEILEQSAAGGINIDTLIVPVGGGGLIAGVAAAVKQSRPQIRVLGVQSATSPAMFQALAQGRVVETPIGETWADGLAGRFVTDLTLEYARQYVDQVFLVSEEAIRRAMQVLIRTTGLVVEASAAASLALVLDQPAVCGSETACILTGRNVDLQLVRQLISD